MAEETNNDFSWNDFGRDAFQAGAGIYSGYQSRKAAEDAARAQNQLGEKLASYAEFKPYSVSSGFGTGYFDTKKGTAGYEIDPMLAMYRDRLYSMGAGAIDQAAIDPNVAAQRFLSQQQGLMAPTREAEDIALRQQQLGRGRIGLGLSTQAMGAGAGGAGGYVNPEQYQRDLARSRADAELATRAYDYGQSEVDRFLGRGTGLFTQGFGVEELGMKPLSFGADLGKAGSTAGANQATSLFNTGQQAIGYNVAGRLANAQTAQNATGLFGQAPRR
jgi:hypothetical protein